MYFIDSVSEGEVVMLENINLSDGLWRIIVKEEAKWKIFYVMQDPTDTPHHLVIPLSLQMGWVESPAYSCTAKDTGQDLI